jgi:hypothetical protein
MFSQTSKIEQLVYVFEDQFKNITVGSVWMIQKSKTKDGFQGWHSDFLLVKKITMTIIVIVGAIKKN